jgi:autotransporter translocation and assembly factor TamB
MRSTRRFLHGVVVLLTLVIGATAAMVIVAETAWFKNLLRSYIVRQANQYLNGQLSIGRLGGNLFFGVELEDIGVSMDGKQVVVVKDLGLDYSVFELISKGLSLNSIRLNQPVIYLRREDGMWSISRLIKKQQQEADRQGPGRAIAVDSIGISDGAVMIDGPVGTSGIELPRRFDHLDARLAFRYEPVRYTIEIAHLSFRGSEPAISLAALSGGVSVRNDAVYVDKLALRTDETSLSIDGEVQAYETKPVVRLRASSDRLSLPEIARLVPALAGVSLQPAFELEIQGPTDRLGVGLNLRSAAGQITAKVLADIVTPGQSLTGDISVRHLDLAPIVRSPREKSDITADAHIDLHSEAFSNLESLRGIVKLAAPRIVASGYTVEQVKADARLEGHLVAIDGRASAYGASATATGQVTLPKGKEPVSYDLHGQMTRVDLGRLPRDLKIPPAATDVNVAYHVTGAGSSSVEGEGRFEESTVAGVRISSGSIVGLSLQGKDVGYRADATLSEIDLQRLGEAFSVSALASDRYKTRINAHVTAAGQGTTLEKMDVTTRGTLTDSTVLGGRIPNLTFDTRLAQDGLRVEASGAFVEFDPAVASGKPAVKGSLGGTVEANATVHGLSTGVNADSVEGSAKITLQPSTIGGLAIDRAAADGSYHESTAEIRTLEIASRDVNVQASGTLALNDAGQSDLNFHADTPSLDEIGKLVDQPLAGIAKVDGTVTGNRTELHASGSLTGNALKYGDNGALSVLTMFSVCVPELRVADATLSTTTNGTFVTLAGQQINEIAAKTDYANTQLDFDATAKQPQRALHAAGSLLEHQEVRLRQLSLETPSTTWQIAPGAQPVVEYASDSIAVRDLRLASANQQIAADGSFGHASDALEVTLSNVDLAGVDALLLRPPQFSGRLNASVTIAGTKEAPGVTGDFQISQGGFRKFRYDALTGKVEYSSRGVTLDARLDQNPSAWITAKGFVPAAAFRAAAASTPRTGSADASPDRIDLHIDSSPIDLGVVQGFTTALTNVKGTLQATVDVTGAADDPRPTGAIAIQNASFTVSPTGVSYANLDGRIDLQSDRVHIEQFKLVDKHQQPMSIAGDLPMRELEAGALNLAIKADDFQVIDNEMGKVRIHSDLRVSGELRQPRVEGDLDFATGQVNLDPILAAISASPYATKPIEYTGGAESGQTSSTSVFDGLTMNVHVKVPDDLIVKAEDLRASADAPVGLGALNVTLGGDVYATKEQDDTIRLVGTVKTVRGTYDFQGRRFDILRDGTVRFEGLDEIDPSLDVRARRVIAAVEADVNVRGTLRQPEIVLTSTPPLPQADILALIVFNQPIDQLGESQQISLVQRAQSMAVGAVAGELADSIGHALNLNTFEIQMPPDMGNTAQVTVGQQVGQNLFVKLQQDIGANSTTNFILEYELRSWLRLQTNIVEGATTQQNQFRRAQGSGVDLVFLFSY